MGNNTEVKKKNWGYRVNISIYIEGDIKELDEWTVPNAIESASDAVSDQSEFVHYAAGSVEEIADEPKEMIAS